MALFEPPRIGDAGDRVWNVDAPVDPIEDRSLGDEFGDVRRIVFGALGLLGISASVMIRALGRSVPSAASNCL